ncbi:C1orf198 (predicted) [Pycnogonum litorale]
MISPSSASIDCNKRMQSEVEEYFSSISPLARKIMMERNVIRERNKDEWDLLSFGDQEKIIWDHFVSPRIQEKYSSTLKLGGEVECYPKLNSGLKLGNDDCGKKAVGNSWKDKHSSPFLWETQSQMDFSYVDDDTATDSSNSYVARNSYCCTSNAESHNQRDVSDVVQDNFTTVKELRNAVKNDVEALLQKKLQNISLDHDSKNKSSPKPKFTSEENIPKTGFDFLDEW